MIKTFTTSRSSNNLLKIDVSGKKKSTSSKSPSPIPKKSINQLTTPRKQINNEKELSSKSLCTTPQRESILIDNSSSPNKEKIILSVSQ